MRSVWFAAGALVALAAAGCGNQYRPVVTPVTPSGPAAQPTAYVIAFSQPNFVQYTPSASTSSTALCPASYGNPGVVTMIDFSGDSVVAQANVGTGPSTFALDPSGSSAYSINLNLGANKTCTSTLSTVPLSATTLQSNKVLNTTLPSAIQSGQTVDTVPTNLLVTSAGEYVVEPFTADLQGQPAIAVLTNSTGGVASVKLEIPVAPALVNVVGIGSGQRLYAISQGNSTGSNVAWGQCDTPSSVSTNGEADGIDIATNTVTSQLAVGQCPVYGLMTPDGRRAFILNRGSGTISVIDSSKNQLDTTSPSNYMKNATINVGAGPVHADLYAAGSLLVTANYDSNTISIIDVSINGAVQGYTDTVNFGHVLATVPVGNHPTAVSVLQDGSRVYVANKDDSTVSVVNLSSFTVEATIPVNGHPRSIASTFNYPIGKVYTVAQDSPYLTVIRTDTNIVSSSILLQGNGVDVHTTQQYAGTGSTSANSITQSRSAGSGAP